MTVRTDVSSELAALAQRELSNLVGGEWVPATGSETADVLDPATGDVLTTIACSSAQDVDRAVLAAARAQPAWAALTPKARALQLLEVVARLTAHLDELAALEALDAGKPLSATRDYEVPDAIDALRFAAGAARTLGGQGSGGYVEGATSIFLREPFGVVGAITPWNYPLLIAVVKAAQALAVGNTVVLKPSEMTPLTTARFVELANEVLAPGVINLVLGTGPEAGNALATHPHVGFVSFTGSVAAGRHVGAAASGGVTPSVLELGGNAPVVVFADADLDAVVETVATAGLYNAGQECMAAARVLVERSRYDDLVGALAARAARQRTGDVLAGATEMGPLISDLQRDRVERKLDGLGAGAQIVTGGGRPQPAGWFLEPTVVANVAADDPIVSDETFGPVMTVQRFADEAEALAMANGTPYGLAASVWTRDVGRALRVGTQLQAGTIWVNDHLNLAADVPITGFGQSGYGTEFGEGGLLAMTRVKHLAVARR